MVDDDVVQLPQVGDVGDLGQDSSVLKPFARSISAFFSPLTK
jgi:hypothetical protein